MSPRKIAVLFALANLAALSVPVHAQLITVTTVLHELPAWRSFAGRIEAIHQATVAAETRGRIEEIRADIGDEIAAGTVILTVASIEQRANLTRAEAALAEANATLTAETAEFQRTNALQARQLISKAELDRAKARLDAAQARHNSAEAALKTAREQLSYTEVRAPYAGVVSARFVEPGELVQPGTLLMSGYDPNALRVEVDLPQLVAEQVRTIGEAVIVPVNALGMLGTTNSDAANNAANLNTNSITPTKLILYPTADAATSSVRARLELPALTADLRPGQFVEARFNVGNRQALLIPQTSVVRRAEMTAVYVVQAGVPILRQIRPGAVVAEQLEVLAGLTPGEEIAADPIAAAQALKSTSVGSKSGAE
jgi:membrane fusion protein, multidrug efflux system